jgi:hypothetical protein
MRKKVSKNDITGDEIRSKQTNDNYRNNFDRIFGNKQTEMAMRLSTSDKPVVSMEDTKHE